MLWVSEKHCLAFSLENPSGSRKKKSKSTSKPLPAQVHPCNAEDQTSGALKAQGASGGETQITGLAATEVGSSPVRIDNASDIQDAMPF